MYKVQDNIRQAGSFRNATDGTANQDFIIDSIRVSELIELLQGELGYFCTMSREVFGRSGASHRFDIVAEKGTERIVIDILTSRNTLLDSFAAEEELNEETKIAAIQMRGKTFDCGCHSAVIIKLSSGLSRGDEMPDGLFQKFLAEFNIDLIEAPDIKTAVRKFRSFVMSTEAI